MAWEVEYTDQFGEWWDNLSEGGAGCRHRRFQRPPARRAKPRAAARGHDQAVETQEQKELIPPASDIRVLFAFDPRRAAILLIAGDKSREWSAWYDRMVPVADDLFDEHLRELASEGAPNAQDP
jgi:hypothetical protein